MGVSLPDQIKNLPVKTTVGTMVGLIACCVFAIFFVDERYAHAEDVAKFQVEQRRAMQQQTLELQKTLLEQDRFRLSLVPPPRRTDADRAILEETDRRLNVVNQQLLNLQQR